MSMDRENPNRGAQAGSQDEAEQWFARLLDRNCPPEHRAAFERWRNADPEHARAYRELEWLWRRSEAAARDPAVMEAARRALRPEAERGASRRWAFPALAGGLAILLAVVALPRWLSAPADPAGAAYSTVAGQQRTVQLADGSSILLDTDSEISVRYSSRTRRVDLLHGQAQFTVQGNHAWPFVVHAGSGTVTAVGTQFQVRVNEDSTDVALLKGKLAIATQATDGTAQSASLIGGESLGYDQHGQITPIHPMDTQQVQGWTQGKLFVHDWRLQQLVQEMNRYSSTKLAVSDPSLKNIHISGIFRTNDQKTFLLLLQQGWAIHARRVGAAEIALSR